MRTLPLPLLVLVLALGTLGCDPAEPIDAGSANYSASLGADPDFSVPHGLIQVETWLQYGENQLSGGFADGPQPYHHTEAERSGSCRLLTFTPSTCEPACEGYDLCVEGECLPWPAYEDRGPLTWGWPDGEQTVQPNEWNGYWATGSTSSEGDVSIAVDGMELTAPTVVAMEADGDWMRQLDNRSAGEDIALRWTNPILDARVRLFMTDCQGTHGGMAEAEIQCEGPDTGELIIPGAYLDLLEAGDWSHGECGTHELERYHAAALEGDDTVRLESFSEAGLYWFPER
jgi:hypothetical protein